MIPKTTEKAIIRSMSCWLKMIDKKKAEDLMNKLKLKELMHSLGMAMMVKAYS